MNNAATVINQVHYNNWGSFILSQGSPKFTLNKFVDIDPKAESTDPNGKPKK